MDTCQFCDKVAVYANPMRCGACAIAYLAGKEDAIPSISVPSVWSDITT